MDDRTCTGEGALAGCAVADVRLDQLDAGALERAEDVLLVVQEHVEGADLRPGLGQAHAQRNADIAGAPGHDDYVIHRKRPSCRSGGLRIAMSC